jgi:hypothetical protein
MNISRDLRHELVDNLRRVPFVVGGGHAGRKALLSGLPNVFPSRDEASSLFADMMLLVTLSAEIFDESGDWCLLLLVDNALPTVQGTEVGTNLVEIRQQLLEIQKGLRRVQANPAEVAQVHLFDLKKTVYECIWSLPPVAKASGFVVTTPTSRLLRYFCESLKQRGAGEGVWGRDEVAATGATMVVDPILTTVAIVASRSDMFRPLLARKHVFWPIYVDNSADAAALWQRLEGAFDEKLEHHLVITFGMPTGTDVPPGMIPLPAPRFTRQDISNWITPIGERLTWRKKEIDWWAKLIMVNCAGGHENLPIEMVYEQLERHYGLITQNRNPDDLMNALKDLELIGG